MSMIGFAVRPGTDVEPMCSTGPMSQRGFEADPLLLEPQPIASRTG
jgi:hypothetical protein